MRITISVKFRKSCKEIKKALIKQKKIILGVLIAISGAFFYGLNGHLSSLALADSVTEGVDLGERYGQNYVRNCIFEEFSFENKLNSATLEYKGDEELCGNEIDIEDALKEVKEMNQEELERDELEIKILNMVGDAPIQAMVSTIVEFDQKVAAFIVGIARKESSWGEHVPTLDGKDCFNYWGYKGFGSRGVGMGYACFSTPEEGARTIGQRIQKLVDQKLDTPQELLVWKCGRSCAGHAPGTPEKWVNDVAFVYNKVVSSKQ